VTLRFDEGVQLLVERVRGIIELPGCPLLRDMTPQDSLSLHLEVAGLPHSAPDQVQLVPSAAGLPEATLVHLVVPTGDLVADSTLNWIALDESAVHLSEGDQDAVQMALEVIALAADSA
jgi:hypothetical protein